MGKKAAPKKVITFCTASVKGKKDIEREAEEAEQAAAAEEARKEAEAEAAAAAAAAEEERQRKEAEAAARAALQDGEDELEEWERLDEDRRERAEARESNDKEDPIDDEEWEKAVERRLEEELQKLERKVIAADATSQLERRGGQPPAGVVVLKKEAEEKIEAALAPLRDEEGCLKLCLPKSWRYKGKLTYERINNIYSTLEALHFTGEQVRLAMTKTAGFDARAPLEWLLANLPKQELPRQFGGESLGDDPAAALAALEAEEGPGSDDFVEGPFGPAALQPDPKEEAAQEAEQEATRQRMRAARDRQVGSSAASVCSTEMPQEEDVDELSGDSDDEGKPKAEAAPAPATDKEAAKDFARRYLEQHEEVDEEDDALLSPEEMLERERKKDPTARYIKAMKQQEESAKTLRALKEKKRKGSFKNASADQLKQRDAANMLLACKAEMELLESGKYGQLDQECIDKAKPVPKPAPKPAPAPKETAPAPEQTPAAEKVDTKEEEAALPSLFDGEEPEEGEKAEAKPAVRSYGLASWTGRMPKGALEDFVKKKIWGKQSLSGNMAKYTKIKCGGGLYRSRVTVTLPRGRRRRFDPEEPCMTAKEAEHLASTLALMKLSEEADRPGLTRGLPPAYRQRWQEWQDHTLGQAKEKKKGLVKERIVFLERMVRARVPAVPPGLTLGTVEAKDTSSSRYSGEDELALQEMSGDAADRLRASYVLRQEKLQTDPDFDQMQQVRQRLPVAEYREQFLRAVKSHGVVVVSGATGSGKTTQVPQYVLEEALESSPNSPLPNIIVTEPRRISAVSVAKRVSEEMGDPPGGPGSKDSLVGYQIRLEKKVSSSTRLLFCTVGVLLKQLQQGLGALSKVTHIFIDEIHERSADCDLLLLLLRQIRGNRPDLRLVLMSATMESDKLVRYFGSSAPVLTIPGRTFPVQAFWLEDAIEMTGYRCEEESDFAKKGWNQGWNTQKQTFQVSTAKGNSQTLTAYIDEDDDWGCDDEAECCDVNKYKADTMRALSYMDHTRINFDLIELILEYIEGSPQFSHVPRDEGATLVFLPGMMEITKMHERLKNNPLFGDPASCLVLSLHSMLSGEDHAKVFDKPRRGVRKIVLSTNIAETGVTIPDVVFVVDAGKVKSQRYHEPSNTSSLKEQFISKAEVLQRRGRAGRVCDGYGFTLVTKNRFDLRLQDMPTPEILRCSLMELMLSVLNSGLQPSCFSEALDPPPKSRIDQALTTLRATGAVEEGVRPPTAPRWGRFDDDEWYVTTPIGQCLARLPCDIRLGKMVLYAALFGSVEAVWSVAATLSHRSPLVTPFSDSKRAQAKATHCQELLPKDGPPSDHIALNTAFAKWDDARRGRVAESFSRKSWLNNQVLQTIREIRNDFLDSLKGDGFLEKFDKSEVAPQDVASSHTVAAIIFAGLYPNVARVDPPKSAAEKFPVLSAGSEQLKVHPGSLCHGRIEGLHRTNHRWICYHTKMKTSQVFLRDCTFLTPNALLLFGGDANAMSIHPSEKSVSTGAGGEKHWHAFNVAPRVAALIRQLRHGFSGVLRRKATDPRQPLSKDDRLILAAYIAVINSVDTDN